MLAPWGPSSISAVAELVPIREASQNIMVNYVAVTLSKLATIPPSLTGKLSQPSPVQSSLDWGDKVIGLNHPPHPTHPTTNSKLAKYK